MEEKWCCFRNKVREVIICWKCEFYKNKVNNFKSIDLRKWWSMVNKFVGKVSSFNEFSYIDEEGRIIFGVIFVICFNEFFVFVIFDIKLFDISVLFCYLLFF